MNSVNLKCNDLKFSDHAVSQMFKRDISIYDIESILSNGKIIGNYPNDKPFPSCLILGFIDDRPIHLVVAFKENESFCIIVTAYQPDNLLWDKDFINKIN